MIKYNNLIKFHKMNNSLTKNLEELKYIQSEISKIEKMIGDLTIPFVDMGKYNMDYYNFADVIARIISGRGDISLMKEIAKFYQYDEIEFLKLISSRLSNFWQNYDQYFKLQAELEDLRKKELILKEKLEIK